MCKGESGNTCQQGCCLEPFHASPRFHAEKFGFYFKQDNELLESFDHGVTNPIYVLKRYSLKGFKQGDPQFLYVYWHPSGCCENKLQRDKNYKRLTS